MSLFSSFDSYFWFFSHTLFLFFYLMIFSCSFLNSSSKFLVSLPAMFFESFFLSLKPEKFNKGFSVVFKSLMFFIFLFNFSSVFSFNFAYTSQVSFVLFVGLSFWVSSVVFFVLYNIKGFLFHFVPEGSPFVLSFVLFVIEVVSLLIRPLTLTIRLVANILAGHLLMILLSKIAIHSFVFSSLYLGLNMVEIFVSFIQAYIFSTMVVLYYSDVY